MEKGRVGGGRVSCCASLRYIYVVNAIANVFVSTTSLDNLGKLFG